MQEAKESDRRQGGGTGEKPCKDATSEEGGVAGECEERRDGETGGPETSSRDGQAGHGEEVTGERSTRGGEGVSSVGRPSRPAKQKVPWVVKVGMGRYSTLF